MSKLDIKAEAFPNRIDGDIRQANWRGSRPEASGVTFLEEESEPRN
jgi:hypothetical protein